MIPAQVPLPPICSHIVGSRNKSIANGDTELSPLLGLLEVCLKCQNQLLLAFDHCLASSTGIQKSATHARNEMRKVIFNVDESFNEKISMENLAADEFSSNTHKKAPKRSIHNGILFSGLMYKQIMEDRNKKILKLREKIYEHEIEGQAELENTKKLSQALERSRKYYCAAEKWQEVESRKLNQDLKYLKAELSILLAFFVNSEKEKLELNHHIDDIQNQIHQNEAKILLVNEKIATVNAKLDDCHKEFQYMISNTDKLKSEAKYGSEEVQSKNDFLQSKLDKLSREFEISTKELNSTNIKIRELEFERNELKYQYKLTTDAKKRLEKENISLTRQLDTLTNDLQLAHKEYKLIRDKVAKMETELLQMEELHAQTTSNLNSDVSELTQKLEILRTEKADFDIQVSRYRVENDRISNEIRTTTRAKDQTEKTLRETIKNNDIQLKSMDNKIKSLKDARIEDELKIAKLNEEKEQFIFQITDLKNALDREASAVNSATFELLQMKKMSEEKISTMRSDIERLQVMKSNLVTEKKVLTEKIKTVRSEFYEQEEKFQNMEQEFENYRSRIVEKKKFLSSEFTNLQRLHQNLIAENKSLQQKYKILCDTQEASKLTNENLSIKISNLENREKQSQQELETLLIESEKCKMKRDKIELENNDTKIHLDQLSEKINELKLRMVRMDEEFKTAEDEKTKQTEKLRGDLQKSEDEIILLMQLCEKLDDLITNLNKELEITISELEAETALRKRLQKVKADLEAELKFEQEERKRLEPQRTKYETPNLSDLSVWIEKLSNKDEQLQRTTLKMQKEMENLTAFTSESDIHTPQFAWL
ncbi:hypothetical protein HK098_000501 [Nowakowskiella sp. JEL0407]|nr:hypothetical protein HK098_000501 [Nowakowskiella sp. JEL0407]